MKVFRQKQRLLLSAVVLFPYFALPHASVAQQDSAVSARPNYAADRVQRAKSLTQPYGWMSLIALQPLSPGITTVGSAKDNSLVLADAPAHLFQLEDRDGRVWIQNAGASVKLRGEPIGKQTEVPMDESEDAAISSGPLRLWVIKRGARLFLRVKDSDAAALKQFHGLRWYAPNDHYRVQARWVPETTGHHMQTVNKLGQLSESSIPGRVEFELEGKRLSLIPLEASNESLWFVFRDETYKTDTDQGGRFLTVKAPATGLKQPGVVQLDFNEAVNPPCAYSPYATCPLAAKENRLPVAIPAGERRYDQ
jgi:uncharacterized protein (DUF1684 family)